MDATAIKDLAHAHGFHIARVTTAEPFAGLEPMLNERIAAGLRAVWFNWEDQSYPQDLPPPTLIVESLGELQAWVENTIAP